MRPISKPDSSKVVRFNREITKATKGMRMTPTTCMTIKEPTYMARSYVDSFLLNYKELCNNLLSSFVNQLELWLASSLAKSFL